LRTRVNISAMGSSTSLSSRSVVGCRLSVVGKPASRRRIHRQLTTTTDNPFSSPARLDHAGNLAVQRELAEAQPAQRELAQVARGRPQRQQRLRCGMQLGFWPSAFFRSLAILLWLP
jgi:hypothetical protein